MTTIVITADEIAWESMQVLDGSERNISPTDKVRTVRRGCVMAFCGDVNSESRIWRWLKRGGDPEKFPKFDRKNDDFEVVIITANGSMISYSEVQPDGAPVSAPYCFGSGGKYARGALQAGVELGTVVTAALAVRAAVAIDVNSGGEIKRAFITDLLKPKRKRKT